MLPLYTRGALDRHYRTAPPQGLGEGGWWLDFGSHGVWGDFKSEDRATKSQEWGGIPPAEISDRHVRAVTGLSTVPLCSRSLALASGSKSGRNCVSHGAVLHYN